MSEKKRPWWWPADREDRRGYFFVATAAVLAAALAYNPGNRLAPHLTIYGFTQPIVIVTLFFMAVIAGVRRLGGPLGPFHFGVIFCVIVVGWGLYGEFAVGRFGLPSDVGNAGDLFGGFSALMSALAFAALITAQYTERENRRKSDLEQEARLQQERVTRAEIDAKQEEQLKIQQDQLALMRQQMETMVSYFKGIDEERKEERRQYRESCQPRFTFDLPSAEKQGGRIIWRVSNLGGDITDVGLDEASQAKGCTLKYDHRMERHDVTAKAQIIVPREVGVRFTFHYRTIRGSFLDSQTFETRFELPPKAVE